MSYMNSFIIIIIFLQYILDDTTIQYNDVAPPEA